MENYYEILGVQKNATQDEIKRAYFKKVRIHSPEKDPENFKMIREAYDVLSNENLRRAYDINEYQEEVKRELERVLKLMDDNDFEKAVSILQKLLQQEIRFAICYILLASCYIRLNFIDKAREVLECALNDDCLDITEKIDIAFMLANLLLDHRMIDQDEEVVDFITELFFDDDEYINFKILSFIKEADETKNIRYMYYYMWLYNYLNEEAVESLSLDFKENVEKYVDILRDLDSLFRDGRFDGVFKYLLIYYHEYRYKEEKNDEKVFTGIVTALYNLGIAKIQRNIENLKTHYNDIYVLYNNELNTMYMTIKEIKEKEENNAQVYNSSCQTQPSNNQQTQAQNKNEGGFGGCLFLLFLLILFFFHC